MSVFEKIDQQLEQIGKIATAGYFLGLRIRGSAPLMAFRTYPQSWTDAYMENGYLLRDPITTWAATIGGSVRWNSPFLPDPFGIFRQAAVHGLKYGASVAHGPVRSISICSFARGDRDLTDDEIAEVRACVIRLHDLTAPPKALTPAQAELLEALEKEGEPAAVAARLGIAEPQARQRIRELCDLLLAQNGVEALQRARDYKLI